MRKDNALKPNHTTNVRFTRENIDHLSHAHRTAMQKPAGSFRRDASDRLHFDMFDVDSMDYPIVVASVIVARVVVARVVARFALTPAGDLSVSLDELPDLWS